MQTPQKEALLCVCILVWLLMTRCNMSCAVVHLLWFYLLRSGKDQIIIIFLKSFFIFTVLIWKTLDPKECVLSFLHNCLYLNTLHEYMNFVIFHHFCR